MKRRGFLFAMITALSLVGFACGRAGSNETKPVDKIADEVTGTVSSAAQPDDGSTNGFVSEPFKLALRDWSGEVGEFAKNRDRANVVKTYALPNKTVFTGEIDDQEMNQWGILTQPTGTRQEGEWRHGAAYHVTGVYVTPDGTREEGTWNHAGTTSGGTIKWKDGRTYTGEWKVVTGSADLPDGTGTMTWPDGRTYTGHFLDGKMDGPGKMTYPDGKIEDGTWMQGKFMGVK
ncbi:MAG: MORN repeat-containing protein [Verrucomicrobiia bacterium]